MLPGVIAFQNDECYILDHSEPLSLIGATPW